MIGFIKNKSFFHLISPLGDAGEDKEAFLVDSQGRLVFHSHPRRVRKILPPKSSLLKSIRDPAKKGKNSWFLKIKKASGEREIFYIKRWKKGEGFLAARQRRGPFVFQGGGWPLKWGALHLIAAFLIFLSAALIALPLASAYRYMKFALIHIGKTGLLPPFREKSRNPFLSFYGNWRLLIGKWLSDKKRAEEEAADKSAAVAAGGSSFQSLARAQAEKLKSRYPGLAMEENFQADIKLWGFGHFMKMILQEIFLNAIEAMGGSRSQKMIISSRIESDQFVFSLRDYGAGAAREDYEKMLQLYYSTKSQLGLGLNVVETLVRSHEGQMELLSPEEGGLEIRISLPMKCFLRRSVFTGFAPPEEKERFEGDSPPPEA